MQPKEPWEGAFYSKFTDRNTIYDAASDTESYTHSWDQRIRPEDVVAFIRQTVLEALGDVNVEKKEHKQGQALMTRAYNQEGRGFNSAIDALEEKKALIRKRFE